MSRLSSEISIRLLSVAKARTRTSINLKVISIRETALLSQLTMTKSYFAVAVLETLTGLLAYASILGTKQKL